MEAGADSRVAVRPVSRSGPPFGPLTERLWEGYIVPACSR
jgi:hypothetical protein